MILKDITPQPLRCMIGGCPSLHETPSGDFILVGVKLVQTEFKDGIDPSKIADNETAVLVPRELLADLTK